MTLSVHAAMTINATYSKTMGASYAALPLRIHELFQFTDGDALNKASKLYVAQSVALPVGENDVYDLIGGGLTDAFGDAVSWTKIKGVYVKNETSGTQPITVTTTITGLGGDTLGGGDATLRMFRGAAGLALAGGSDSITITNGDGTAATYTIALIGV